MGDGSVGDGSVGDGRVGDGRVGDGSGFFTSTRMALVAPSGMAADSDSDSDLALGLALLVQRMVPSSAMGCSSPQHGQINGRNEGVSLRLLILSSILKVLGTCCIDIPHSSIDTVMR